MNGLWEKRISRQSGIAALVLVALSASIGAQEAEPQEAVKTDKAVLIPPTTQLSQAQLKQLVQTQIELLDSEDFRTRQLARWRLRQHPYQAIVEILRVAPTASVTANMQHVELLDEFSSHPDISVSMAAFDTLKQFASSQGTALGCLANKSIHAIADANELHAYDILTHAGAKIGNLRISVNGTQTGIYGSEFISLELKAQNFVGNPESLSWIRYLKSVELVSLEGDIVTPEVLAIVAQMANCKKVLLRKASVTPDDLLLLASMDELQHLELSYMKVDDSFVPAICQLPLSQTLRLFGTDVTAQGQAAIERQLDGLDVYRGAGGFLGIGSPPTGEVVVTNVLPGSSAANAGLRREDVITHIRNDAIKDFAELRANLAKYRSGEIVKLRILRPTYNPTTEKFERVEMELTSVLGEQPN